MTRIFSSTLGLFLLYALVVALGALAARWLGRSIPRRWLLAFALPPLLFFWQGFLLGKSPLPADHAYVTLPSPGAVPTNVWADDVGRQFAPWARAVRLAWKRGELPHRNRWNGCGMALAANGTSSAYFPLTLAALLLPLPAAFTFWAAARLFLCLAGTWLWLVELRVSRPSAYFGAVAFTFSISMTGWLGFPQTAVLCLWPWVLWAIERLRDAEAASRARALLTLLFVLMPLAGHLETVASFSAFTAIWLAGRWVGGDRQNARAIAFGTGAAALTALGLSAFSVLPQALAILDSNRLPIVLNPFWTPILSFRPHWPPWPAGMLAILFPRLFGDRVSAPMIAGGAASFPEMALGYFGIVGAAAAALFLRPGSKRSTAEWALLAAIALGLGAATGCWPIAEIASLPPGLRHMFPVRFLSWVALAGSALAAFELDRLAADLGRRRWAGIQAGIVMAAGILAAPLTYAHFRSLYAAAGALDAERHAYLLAGGTLAAALSVLVLTGGRAKRFAALGIPLWTLIAGAELFRQGARLNRMGDPALLYPATPLVRFLASRSGTFRVAGEGAAMFPDVGIFAGVEDIRTHDPVERHDYVEFLDATCGYTPDAYFKALGDVNARALDFLNVQYLVTLPGRAAPSEKWKSVYAGPDGSVFENSHALERVRAPERVRVVRRIASGFLQEPADRAYGRTYRKLFAGLDWKQEAVVLDDGRGDFHPVSSEAGRSAEVTDYVETTNAASFRARVSEGPGEAVLVTSLVQDGGWRAHDERGTVPTGRANGPFLALTLPAGDHRVRLAYAPPGLRVGAWISLVSAGLVLAMASSAAVRRAG